jgi:hypothetical protein
MRGGVNASCLNSRWIFPPKAKYSYEKVLPHYPYSSVPQNQQRIPAIQNEPRDHDYMGMPVGLTFLVDPVGKFGD